MSKELTQKIIEAGIVPEYAVRQLKAWRQLPDDIPEEERQQITQQQLMEFVQDIGELLEEDGEVPELRETMPGVNTAFESGSRDCTVVINASFQPMVFNIRVLVDRLDCLIFKADQYGEFVTRIGNQVSWGDGKVYEISETTPLYQGTDVVFYRCKAQEVPEHAQVSELRQFSE